MDKLFERLYEDNVAGKITDDRYARMARNYEDEQQQLAEQIKDRKAELDKHTSAAMTTDMFIACVRKYTRARKLTPRMLNELIEKIEIYGGCNGNLKGITSLITGCDAATVVKKLKGICCGDKTTSCPDQIATALELALKKNLT